jgi:hypothetical protein
METTTSAGVGPAEVLVLLISLAIFGLFVWGAVVCWLKGKNLTAVLGFLFFGPAIIIGACRLAKPDSKWAADHYFGTDAPKMAKARVRFPENAAAMDAITPTPTSA